MNLSPSNRLPRETQTIRCCGLIYRRWRFVGGKFPAAQTQCCRCHANLHFQPNYKPKTQKQIDREAYRRRRERFVCDGLTAHGAQRVKPSLTREERLSRLRACYKRRTAERRKAGLTSRGRPYKYKSRAITVRGRYDEFRASLNIEPPEFLFTLARAEEAA